MNVPVLKNNVSLCMIMWLHIHKDRTKFLIKYQYIHVYSNIISNRLKVKIMQIVIEWFFVKYGMNV